MLNKFLDHIKRENLCKEGDKILLAISGGRDSMVLLDLFKNASYPIGVAHFNHVTRDGASDQDEAFVKEICANDQLPFYSKKIDIKRNFPDDNFQERARILRYEFFTQVSEDHGYDLIATAHHLDDQFESFLIHYARGSGLAGLTGIRPKLGQIIRPLMFCGSAEIKTYQESNKIQFVEDASNAADDYLRNRVRHHIVPSFKVEFPSLLNTVKRNHQNLNSSHQLLLHFIEDWKKTHFEIAKDEVRLDKHLLAALPSPLTMMHYLYAQYGFNRDQLGQLLSSINEVGTNYYSASHRILVDRKQLILIKNDFKLLIDQELSLGVNELGAIKLEISMEQEYRLDPSSNIELVDMDKLVFPLRVRNWRAGDKFLPLGMSGKSQKVKDFLINSKVPQHEKEKVLVLLSEDKIVWLIGHRLDHRFSINDKSTRYLKMNYK